MNPGSPVGIGALALEDEHSFGATPRYAHLVGTWVVARS